MIVWLWDAPGSSRMARGITGDAGSARRAAAECLRSGHAASARVEKALGIFGGMEPRYLRTGDGWDARAGTGGGIRWVPFTGAERSAGGRDE